MMFKQTGEPWSLSGSDYFDLTIYDFCSMFVVEVDCDRSIQVPRLSPRFAIFPRSPASIGAVKHASNLL
jgi:hypothetical protein